jgi:hypothetical protein
MDDGWPYNDAKKGWDDEFAGVLMAGWPCNEFTGPGEAAISELHG